ncbi:hypothetical protein MBLNU459_g6005t1 [Dothideomycetes sp. NU459]
MTHDVAPLHRADWTCDIPDSDHVAFFKSVDWAATLLGPVSQWSNALRLYTYNVFADSRPAVMYWGPNKVAIYNEAFVPLAGKAHPALMGTRFEDGFPEIWDNIRPIFEAAAATKRAVDVIEIPLMVERSGFIEEAYFTGNFNPLRGDDGAVGGFYNALGEVTKQKLNDRRKAMLNLASAPSTESTETIGVHIISALQSNPLDVPFALFYQVDETSGPERCSLNLRGSIGVPAGHTLAVQRAYIESGEGFMPLLRKARADIVTFSPGPEFEGIEWAGYGEPSKAISAVALCESGRSFGFLLVGANPRRPVDEDHKQFMRELRRNLSSTIAFTISTAESHKRQQHLMSQLIESERKIRYMAQHLDIGMEHLTLDGRILWANEHYYRLAGKDASSLEGVALPFTSQVLDEDQPGMRRSWERVRSGKKAHTMELRMKRLFSPPSGGPIPATVLLSAFPYIEDNEVKSVMACMTDVSRLKWAEAWQARAANEAQEAKRLQSEFTDAISHEVRNPLSAIMQLADSIAGGCGNDPNLYKQKLEENIEAAKTILICATHQKRIVDDVLTLSKMDFTMVSLSPTSINPSHLADGALKMLAPDLSSSSVELHLVPDPSLEALDITWVICDSLRVTQILINLLSNAIKFTRREPQRNITMRYGASLSSPRESLPSDIVWAAPKGEYRDVTMDRDWGSGEPVYLTFLIQDTGPGMTAEELRRLFRRFEQASPRTSIKYGGSGLGLFISHSLSEKQSGGIGVSSQPGKGSTFAFYIKSRRSAGPPAVTPDLPFSRTIPSLPVQRMDSPSRDARERQLNSIDTMTAALFISDEYPNSPSPVASPPATPPLYHVLLVEDNVVNQRILRKQLVKAGCVVYVANHGLEALEILQTMSCWNGNAATGKILDIVLMDWEMPVCDGLTCSREIRDLERSGEITRHIEIVAITANVRQEQIDKAMAAGMNAVMPKPFVVSDLLATIQQRLGR